VKDLGGRVPPWGYTESVLIDGDKLICTPGSETKGTFAALDKKTGNSYGRAEKSPREPNTDRPS
jgi:outer membrane protein assembly factor BamB